MSQNTAPAQMSRGCCHYPMRSEGILIPRIFDGGLGGSQPGDGHTVGGAGHIVQAHLVAELHGGGVAAVLAADAQVDAGTGGAAHVGGQDRKSVV